MTPSYKSLQMRKQLLLTLLVILGITINGYAQCLAPIAQYVNYSDIESTTAVLNWQNGAIEDNSWEILLIPALEEPLPPAVNPEVSNGTKLYTVNATFSFIANNLTPGTQYYYYIRKVCSTTEKSPWSGSVIFTTNICSKPLDLTVRDIMITSASLSWIPRFPTDNSWEILIIPGLSTPVAPSENPVIGNGSFLIPVTGDLNSLDVNGLETVTQYYCYIRTVCTQNSKSEWAGPYPFKTPICNPADKCNYKFIMTDSGGNGWNGGRIQVRQNGIIVQTIGQSITGGGPTTVTVALCNNVPFDLYWSVEGTAPAEIGLTIQNPFSDIIYTKVPGSGNPLDVLYSSVGSCTSSCPKPTVLTMVSPNTTQTTADLIWTESGTAVKWEVYADITGAPLPINGSPINGGPAYHIVDSLPYHLTGLLPGKSYTYYVRALCSDTDIGTWTILSPKTFVTKPVYDDCEFSVTVPVNPTKTGTLFVSGNTLGATQSLPNTAPVCPGTSDDDVWFSFTATSTIHIITISNVVFAQGTGDMNHTLYEGNNCGTMIQLYCSNPDVSIAKNLVIGNTYKIRVYTSGSTSLRSATFNLCVTTTPLITNDECSDAISIIVNEGTGCNSVVYGSLTTATASPQVSTCLGSSDDDVWFRFEATSPSLQVSLFDITGTTTNLNFSVYSGTCGNLITTYCSSSGSLNSLYADFIPGQVYYLRVWSNQAINQVVDFSVCVKSTSTCSTAEPFCGSSSADPYIYQNSTGINQGTTGIACLGSAPNPTYYTLHVGQTGPLNFNIAQNTQFDADGNPIGNNIDVDFVAFGPFSSAQSCDLINFTPCPAESPCPNNIINPTFYPLGNIADCSYDASSTETLSLPNAITGEYYIVLVTNFSNQPGYIRLMQTNFFEPNAGHTLCEDKIQLVSFIDTNANGIKENEEANFNLGTFNYQKNNAGIVHNISSPVGKHTLYDTNPLNTYDFSFTINPEFAAHYSLAATNFNDLNIPVGSGSQILYFPITITQAYSDVEVSIVPMSQARPGFTYSNKIIYKNLGIAPVSGTLTFTKSPAVTINNVSEPTVNTATGFTFDYTNLAAHETRSLIVNMDIPNLPVVQLGEVLTNTVGTTSPLNDINVINNLASVSETIIGSYDPNDKVEAHGPKVEFTQFSQDDYLTYTIRFQNTGNASAINVRVEDLLDSKLDETSIRMVSASHNYTLERVNNKLVWSFNNIMLPGAFINGPLSHGYVTFNIKAKPGFVIGDIIPNTAEIYFDTNPAIVTNTVNTEFVPSLNSPDFSAGNIMVYPNPANDHVQISIMNTNESINSIVLYDMLGKTISRQLNVNSKATTLDVSPLAKGVYMIEITIENKLRQVKKLVIE